MAHVKEFKARNVKAAVTSACEELGVDENSLDFEILTHGSSGIFGLIGAKKAVIRVTIGSLEKETYTDSETIPEASSGHKETDSPVVKPDDNEQHHREMHDFAEDLLGRIVDSISDETRLRSQVKGNLFEFEITGGNSAILIGKRGQTLEAIQFIVEKAVNKKAAERFRVQIDIEGYLAQKRANLVDIAERMALRARKSGKPATLGQMNAYDRRIVHMALKKDQRVRTQSIGEGHLRKLVIFPKKGNYSKKRNVSPRPR